MGKRGPKPKGPYASKTSVLSTRIRPETRAALESVAKAKRRPLSQEIEHRLRRSFDEDTRIESIFGNAETYGLMRAIASVVNVTATNAAKAIRAARHGKQVDWMSDPYVYDQAVRSIRVILELFRPPGDRSRPPLPVPEGVPKWRVRKTESEIYGLGEGITWGEGAAINLLRAIRDAPDGNPLPEDDDLLKEARRIRDALGPVAKRLSEGGDR